MDTLIALTYLLTYLVKRGEAWAGWGPAHMRVRYVTIWIGDEIWRP